MKILSIKSLLLTLTVSMSVLSGCSSNKSQDMAIDGYVTARTTINPDINGDARPVNITLYYLNDAEAFNEAGFFDLFSNAEETLGDSLLKTNKILSQPGIKQRVDLEAPKATKAVGLVAAFRDIDQSQWRAIVLTPEKCFMSCDPGLEDESLYIEVKRLSVALAMEGEKDGALEPGEVPQVEEKSAPEEKAGQTKPATDKRCRGKRRGC